MKPVIPKEPSMPELSIEEMTYISTLVFGNKQEPELCDVLFIYSGTHPGHWEKAIEAYQNGYAKSIIVTGGKSLTGVPHPDWDKEVESEADVILTYLLEAGVPQDIITYEKKSTNTLENVLYAKEVYDFSSTKSILFVCKSHVAGRQYRTLAKHLSEEIRYIPYTFDCYYNDVRVGRDNWMESEEGRKRVWGEYLRIQHYGELGHILPVK
ncbi:YdcF family protein [Guptibacillus algicola]|uniref:YdcF family protein n=1 Tax=Guptibacillus algicola TaxID=225844 RepID=UPI001CD1EDA7|nr:YdcF family protein [Alkalihalobacillus algicola]MCA0988478.1 YdcF family protein [Alkalihalobacillus algicola]